MAVPLLTEHPTMDAILDDHREVIGDDFTRYRNHCLFVLNATRLLADPDDADLDAYAVAVAFHDIGLWTAGTMDYLDPSADAAEAYLRAQGRAALVPAVTEIIQEHHKLRHCRGEHATLAEPFRRADTNFVSLGLLRGGLDRADRRRLVDAFPNQGFHKMLVRFTGRRLRTKPWSPLPMMRW